MTTSSLLVAAAAFTFSLGEPIPLKVDGETAPWVSTAGSISVGESSVGSTLPGAHLYLTLNNTNDPRQVFVFSVKAASNDYSTQYEVGIADENGAIDLSRVSHEATLSYDNFREESVLVELPKGEFTLDFHITGTSGYWGGNYKDFTFDVYEAQSGIELFDATNRVSPVSVAAGETLRLKKHREAESLTAEPGAVIDLNGFDFTVNTTAKINDGTYVVTNSNETTLGTFTAGANGGTPNSTVDAILGGNLRYVYSGGIMDFSRSQANSHTGATVFKDQDAQGTDGGRYLINSTGFVGTGSIVFGGGAQVRFGGTTHSYTNDVEVLGDGNNVIFNGNSRDHVWSGKLTGDGELIFGNYWLPSFKFTGDASEFAGTFVCGMTSRQADLEDRAMRFGGADFSSALIRMNHSANYAKEGEWDWAYNIIQLVDSADVSLGALETDTEDVEEQSKTLVIGCVSGGTTLHVGARETDAAATNVFAGVICEREESGYGVGVEKTGGGTWVLKAPQRYAGATVVSGGTLLLDMDSFDNSSVTVNAGGAIGGSAIIGSVDFAGGSLADGNAGLKVKEYTGWPQVSPKAAAENAAGANGYLKWNVKRTRIVDEATQEGYWKFEEVIGFKHPGYAFDREDLEWVKARLGEEPFKSRLEKLVSDNSLDYEMKGPFDVVGRNPSQNLWEFNSDMDAAFEFARLWYFTDDERYAAKSREILLSWAATHTNGWTGAEGFIAIGDEAYHICGAAEILRGTWEGWSDEDTETFKQYLLDQYWWMCPSPRPLHSAVQGALQASAGLAIAVFCDDAEKFGWCLDSFLNDPIGGIGNSTPLGQAGDSGRDQGHLFGQLISWAMAAETYWKQGVDVYSSKDFRLHAIDEYFTRYNLGLPTPFIRFGSEYGVFGEFGGAPESSPKPRDLHNIIHKAYARLGIPTPHVDAYRSARAETADTMMFMRDDDASTAVPASEQSPLPEALPVASLLKKDINGPGAQAPSATISGGDGTWTIVGSGDTRTSTIVDGNADSYTLFYLPVGTNAEIVARIDSIEEEGAEETKAMAGIMVCEQLISDCRKLTIRMGRNVTNDRYPGMGTRALLNMRSESASCSSRREQQHSLDDPDLMPLPCWLKLERRGDRVTAFHSIDGGTWSPMQNVDFDDLAETCYAGIYLANGTNVTAEFSNVAITQGEAASVLSNESATSLFSASSSGETPLPPALFISAAAECNIVRWLSVFGAKRYCLERKTTDGEWGEIASTTGNVFIDEDVASGVDYSYRVIALDEDGNTRESGVWGSGVSPPLAPSPCLTPSVVTVPCGGLLKLESDLESDALTAGENALIDLNGHNLSVGNVTSSDFGYYTITNSDSFHLGTFTAGLGGGTPNCTRDAVFGGLTRYVATGAEVDWNANRAIHNTHTGGTVVSNTAIHVACDGFLSSGPLVLADGGCFRTATASYSRTFPNPVEIYGEGNRLEHHADFTWSGPVSGDGEIVVGNGFNPQIKFTGDTSGFTGTFAVGYSPHQDTLEGSCGVYLSNAAASALSNATVRVDGTASEAKASLLQFANASDVYFGNLVTGAATDGEVETRRIYARYGKGTTLHVGSLGEDGEWAGLIGEENGCTLDIEKTGAGAWTLSGTNYFFTGTLTVSEGAVLLANATPVAMGAKVVVKRGAAIGGGGTLTNPVVFEEGSVLADEDKGIKVMEYTGFPSLGAASVEANANDSKGQWRIGRFYDSASGITTFRRTYHYFFKGFSVRIR